MHPFVPCGTNHYPETTWRDENPEKAAFHGSAVKNCEGLVAGGHGLIGPVVNVHGSWQQPLGVPQAAKYAPPPLPTLPPLPIFRMLGTQKHLPFASILVPHSQEPNKSPVGEISGKWVANLGGGLTLCRVTCSNC